MFLLGLWIGGVIGFFLCAVLTMGLISDLGSQRGIKDDEERNRKSA